MFPLSCYQLSCITQQYQTLNVGFDIITHGSSFHLFGNLDQTPQKNLKFHEAKPSEISNFSVVFESQIPNFTLRRRYIPSEKIGQNIDPLRKSFLSLIIYTGLVQVYYSHFWAPRTPGGVWGAMGGF